MKFFFLKVHNQILPYVPLKLYYCLQPGPRDFLLQCFIKRNRTTQTYHLYLGLTQGNRFFSAAILLNFFKIQYHCFFCYHLTKKLLSARYTFMIELFIKWYACLKIYIFLVFSFMVKVDPMLIVHNFQLASTSWRLRRTK